MKRHLIKTALRNLHSATLRTVLAMLGILVGTASVVAMVSTGQMATNQALAEFKNLTTNLYAINLYTKSTVTNTQDVDLTINDLLNIKSIAPTDILYIAPFVKQGTPVFYEGDSYEGMIIGATESLAEVIRIQLLEGRFISPLDNYEKFCVIGNDLYEKMKLKNPNVLGTPISLGKQVFTIIGVAAHWPENSFFYENVNSSVIVPINTMSYFNKNNSVNDVLLLLTPHANIQKLTILIQDYFNKIAPTKQIYTRSATELLKSLAAQHNIFTLLLALIGSISLFVGGIGVMNIMLVSVIERKREIGIRLALGAHRHEIQMMFLTESILLSVVSGILGVFVGIISSSIIAYFAGWSFHLFLLPIFIGFIVSVITGVFFGFYPAFKASKLNPIDTLRSE